MAIRIISPLVLNQKLVFGNGIPRAQKDIQTEDRVSMLVAGCGLASMLLGRESQFIGHVQPIGSEGGNKTRQERQQRRGSHDGFGVVVRIAA